MKANRKQVACDCQLYTHMCMKAQTDTHAAYKAHRWKYKTTLIILRYWENGEVKRDTMQWLMIENSLNKVRMWQNSQSVQRTVKQVSYSLSGTGGGVFYPGCEIKARLFPRTIWSPCDRRIWCPPHTQTCTHNSHFNSSLTKTTFCKLTQQPQLTKLTKMKEEVGRILYKTFFMSYQRQILNKHCKMGY